ncbi:MAG: hypothetical protein ACJAYU_004725 [Bradymonadia bacterium]|jgi:hypothetical protein
MIGKNTASAIAWLSVCWNAAITLAATTLSPMLIESQLSRREARVRRPITRSSSPPTIPWDFR